MSNPYIHIYNNQVGSGIPVFQGVRTQRGHGWFGRLAAGVGNLFKSIPQLFQKHGSELMKSVVLPSATALANDYIEGKNLKEAAKERLSEAGKKAGNYALDKIRTEIQGGSGRKRRRPGKGKRKTNKRRKKSKW